MAEQLAVLFRDGSHAGATNRFALKVEQLSIAIARTPMQIPVASLSPEIIDIRMSRPTITISGVVDNTPQDASGNDDSNFWDMEYITISGQKYYIPYKNFFEQKLLQLDPNSTDLQIEVGNAATPISTSGTVSTGGGIYHVAIQQMQFTVAPAMEDRWQYSLQLISKWRSDIS